MCFKLLMMNQVLIIRLWFDYGNDCNFSSLVGTCILNHPEQSVLHFHAFNHYHLSIVFCPMLI